MSTSLRRLAVTVGAAFGLVAAATTAGAQSPSTEGPLGRAFTAAAERFDVPRDLLVTLAYAVTRVDDHGDRPSASGGHGVMHLISNPRTDTLGEASELSGHAESELRTDTSANIDGAAAVLRARADAAGLDATDRDDLGAWYEPVARYSDFADDGVARLEADAVFELLDDGLRLRIGDERLVVRPHDLDVRLGAFAGVATLDERLDLQSDDYGPAHWVPASSSNYRASSRPGSYAIDRVVIHTAQGSYAGTISWFQNPSASVSSHYVIRSSDGDVTQMVRHKDVAWHAGNWNNRSIGIEHEGFVDNASWYTESMYRSSAAVTRHAADQYGIPLDRTHVVGHSEVPGATHTDPGPNWDWNRYMSYVRGDDPGGWNVVVDNTTSGAFTASGNWAAASAPGQYGSDHRHAQPLLASDPAWFGAELPEAGRHRVEVWYPADPANNARTPYIVSTTSGNQTVYVDQRTNGGRWVELGTFDLDQGRYNVVGVSRWTSSAGSIEADAVRISAT